MRKVVAIMGLLVSAACLAWLIVVTDWAAVGQAIRRVSLAGWLLGSGLYLLSFFPRALRWQLMLPPVPSLTVRESAAGVVLGFAANNLLPLRLGEVVRAGVVGDRHGLSKVTCLASVFAEKILDGLCLLLALFLSLHFLPVVSDSDRVLAWLGWGAAVIFGLASVAAVLLVVFESRLRKLAERRLPRAARVLFDKTADALRFLQRGRVLLAIAGLSLLVWAIEGATFAYFLQRLGIERPVERGFFCLAFINLSILVPSAPGYVGVFQAGAAGAFAVMGLARHEGIALSVLAHSAQFIPVTLAGLALAPFFGLRWREVYRTPHSR